MIKYFCDICENEITAGEEKIGVLDFTNKFLNLCPTCKSKFKEAKASLYNEYKVKYEVLDTEYLNKLKQEILTNVEPDPEYDPIVI